MTARDYIEVPVTPRRAALLGKTLVCKAYEKDDLRIIVTRDVLSTHELRWHMSISCVRRYPVWDEIRDARYALLPDNVTMAMLLPPKSQYVNLHPNCFHLHEIIH